MDIFDNIGEVNVGLKIFDTFNDFNNPKFNFIKGEKYTPELSICEVIEITSTSVCVRVKKFPLRYLKGSLSNPIECIQWYKFKREHQYDVIFPQRFKKINLDISI